MSISTLGCLIASQHYNNYILTSQNKASECNLHSINHPLSSNNNDIEGFADASKFIKGSKIVAGTIHYSIAEGTNDLTIIDTENVIAENPEFLGDIYLTDSQTEPYKLAYLGGNNIITLQSFHFSGKLTLPSTLLEIRKYFFQACYNLTSVDLSKCFSLTSIGYGAFRNNEITSIDFTKYTSLTSIGSNAFNLNPLTSIDLSKCTSLTSIGSNVFYNCTGLTSISLPNSLTSIEINAFGSCPIKQVNFEGNGTYKWANNVGQGHLLSTSDEWDYQTSPVGCLAYGDIDMSKATDLSEIKTRLFNSCAGVTSIDLSNCTSLTSIGSSAFYGCSGLTSISLPSSLETIENYAFEQCNNLTSISLPSSLTSIGEYAFGGCPIKQVNFEGNDTYKWANNVGQGHLLFTSDKWNYKTAPIGCLAYGDIDLSNCPKDTVIFTQPTFENCAGIISVKLPDYVKQFNDNVFNNCTNLQKINLNYVEILKSNLLEGDMIGPFSNNTNLSDINLSSIIYINDDSFFGCSNLKSIKFGSHLSTLEEFSFSLCTNISSITFNWNKEELSQLDSTKYSNLWLKNAVGESNMKNVTVYVPKGLVDTYEIVRTRLGIENCKIEEVHDPINPTNNLSLILGLSLGLGIPALTGAITGAIIGIQKHKTKKHNKKNSKK